MLSSSYTDALHHRLLRIHSELEIQMTFAVSLRRNVESTEREAEENQHELARLRKRWATGQPQREALLQEMGDAERRLMEREKRCAEALAARAAELAAEKARGAEATMKSAGDAEPLEEGADAEVAALPSGPQVLHEQRQRLLALEEVKGKLTMALRELQEAVRQEAASVGQLNARSGILHKETNALQAGAAAAKEQEARSRQRADALGPSLKAAQQRQQAQERQNTDLRAEVQGLKAGLAAATSLGLAAAATSAATATATVGPTPERRQASASASRGPPLPDLPLEATNCRLQEKVSALREDLRRKQDELQRLRSRLVSVTLDAETGAVAADGTSTNTETETPAATAARQDGRETWPADTCIVVESSPAEVHAPEMVTARGGPGPAQS
jgi:outer membrane murein-binding lipoprotein Lpp